MKLSIEHETYYRFTLPAHHSTQYLRLTPRPDACQSVLSWHVSTPGTLNSWVDGFNNVVHTSVQNGTHDEVPVVVRGVVETTDTNGILPTDDGLPPDMFMRETQFTRVEGGIEDLAEGYRERLQDEGGVATLHALMWGLHETVAYHPGYTDSETTAAEALEHGHGVCQDHAHLLIACCRVLGFPARYVSGYLFLEGEGPGSVASHAWAEAFVSGLGWVSFDPSNGVSATDSYVRLAVAFDYAGACPVRGVRKGGGVEEMTVRVQVTDDQ